MPDRPQGRRACCGWTGRLMSVAQHWERMDKERGRNAPNAYRRSFIAITTPSPASSDTAAVPP